MRLLGSFAHLLKYLKKLFQTVRRECMTYINTLSSDNCKLANIVTTLEYSNGLFGPEATILDGCKICTIGTEVLNYNFTNFESSSIKRRKAKVHLHFVLQIGRFRIYCYRCSFHNCSWGLSITWLEITYCFLQSRSKRFASFPTNNFVERAGLLRRVTLFQFTMPTSLHHEYVEEYRHLMANVAP